MPRGADAPLIERGARGLMMFYTMMRAMSAMRSASAMLRERRRVAAPLMSLLP